MNDLVLNTIMSVCVGILVICIFVLLGKITNRLEELVELEKAAAQTWEEYCAESPTECAELY